MNWIVIAATVFLSSCAPLHYARTDVGVLEGAVLVEWIDEDTFIFRPLKERPFKFTRSDGSTVIEPGTMVTDGGSIPRPLWAIRNYSPWGYAPAFMVHDWLFEMHHCKDPGYARYTVDDAAWIMTEAMKTMIEQRGGPIAGEKFVVYSMFEAVRSPAAISSWEAGICRHGATIESGVFEEERAEGIQYLLDFDEPEPR